ncbi:MAG TPA: ribosome-associated translation inhibitor RaiA [Opitutaceae bacterium]|nr:ribosome-associated translation inhibitor RaiA [Opitutaceae bacterium]
MPSPRAQKSTMPLPSERDPAERILVQCIHVDLTPAMHRVIIEKLTPLIRHDRHIVRLNLRIHKDQKMGGEYHYTATAQIEVRGPDVVAHAEGKDAYAVIDQLVEKLDHLLERRHDRRKDRRNHPQPVEIPADIPKADES